MKSRDSESRCAVLAIMATDTDTTKREYGGMLHLGLRRYRHRYRFFKDLRVFTTIICIFINLKKNYISRLICII